MFDVAACKDLSVNDEIYKIDNLTIDIYKKKNLFKSLWYQHHGIRNRSFHFLVALRSNTFKMVKGFSYDYSFVSWYDDDDFLFKIKTLPIDIILIPHETQNVGGIHLFHPEAPNTSGSIVPRARDLYGLKVRYYNKYKVYLEISEGSNLGELIYRYECLNSNKGIGN